MSGSMARRQPRHPDGRFAPCQAPDIPRGAQPIGPTSEQGDGTDDLYRMPRPGEGCSVWEPEDEESWRRQLDADLAAGEVWAAEADKAQAEAEPEYRLYAVARSPAALEAAVDAAMGSPEVAEAARVPLSDGELLKAVGREIGSPTAAQAAIEAWECEQAARFGQCLAACGGTAPAEVQAHAYGEWAQLHGGPDEADKRAFSDAWRAAERTGATVTRRAVRSVAKGLTGADEAPEALREHTRAWNAGYRAGAEWLPRDRRMTAFRRAEREAVDMLAHEYAAQIDADHADDPRLLEYGFSNRIGLQWAEEAHDGWIKRDDLRARRPPSPPVLTISAAAQDVPAVRDAWEEAISGRVQGR